jgi:hypothetical protein
VHVRILLTAKDSPTLFDLRCYVRESLVAWVQSESQHSLPRQRVIVGEPPKRQPSRPKAASPAEPPTEGLFTGSLQAVRRADHFTGDTSPMALHDENGDTGEGDPVP